MRVCACLWGGIYNPIIPVFTVGPKEWRKEHWRFSKGRNVAKGYVEFFEPDAFVEAEPGLLDEAGLQGVRRQYENHSRVLPLGDLLKKQDGRDFAELSAGLSVIGVLRDIYKSERRFALRQESPAYFVKPERGSAAVDALFGAYPTGKASAYFEKAYKDVFRPEIVAAGPAAWTKVFSAGASTPLRITRHNIKASRSWSDDLVVYVFDPKRPTDLIDLWNMRLEPSPVLPVPVGWAQELALDIAKQVLSHLGGLRGADIIAHTETLQTLNKMAGGIRVGAGGDEPEAEEVFGRHSKSFAEWKAILSRRAKGRSFRETTLDRLTDANVLRLGVETTCPQCKNSNWHSISDADYSLRCDRCLKTYPFPQGNVTRQWSYRAIGPFAVPDYAKGSYGAVLALHALKSISGHMTPMTYSTALTMKFDGAIVEADYVAWIGKETMRHSPYEYPRLVLGEAKSFGKGELIKAGDVAQLKKAAAKLPGATLAVSVLRDDFTDAEKTLLTDLARWGRKLDERGEHRNPLLLLTGTELLNYNVTLEGTWKDNGGEHAKFADYRFTHGLHAIAESTVAIHLGLPSYEEERWRAADERAKHRRERLLAKKAGQ